MSEYTDLADAIERKIIDKKPSTPCVKLNMLLAKDIIAALRRAEEEEKRRENH